MTNVNLQCNTVLDTSLLNAHPHNLAKKWVRNVGYIGMILMISCLDSRYTGETECIVSYLYLP